MYLGPVANKMMLQLALQDIGQLTDFEPTADETEPSSAHRGGR
jgi:hypothetical protein